ncbi:dehydrogenase [Bacteroidia bacterium]|nr:dehydrogenase [Bacteroidia bacterium]
MLREEQNFMTERIQYLRKLLFANTHKQYRVKSLGVSVLDEENEQRSITIRKALAMKQAMELMPIYIQPGELIVGGKTVYSLPTYFTKQEIALGNPNSEVHGYSNMFDIVFNLGQDERGYGQANSSAPDYAGLLEYGFTGMLEQSGNGLKEAKTERQKDFYESVAIVYEGIRLLLGRYEKLAQEQQKETKEQKRKDELSKIADTMHALAHRPPKNFYEALQTVYFVQFLLWQEGGYLVPLGRFDQYMYPYYRHSLEKGEFSHEEMEELVECMFLKLNYEIDETHGEDGKFESDTGQTVTVGGVIPATGEDATNELSYMCIDIKIDLHVVDPRLHVRFHENTDPKLWKRSADLSAEGMGFPTYDSDENIIAALLCHPEYTLEDARDYCSSGCWEIIIQGKSFNRNLGDIDCLRALEWALNDGESVIPVNENAIGLIEGRFGLRTGHPANFEIFEDLIIAFKAQLKHNIDTIACNCNKGKLATAPLYSSVMKDCMTKGLDLAHGGGRYYETDFQLSSLSNAADALYAIKKLVYEDKRFALDEFVKIMHDNYEGHEELRQELINKMPKFGNADERVDAIAKDIVSYFSREVTKHRNHYDGPYRARIASSLGYVAIARTLGASADGRRHKDFYAADLSPGLGAERNGPTAAVISCGSMPTKGLAGGSIMDLTFHSGAFATQDSKDKFIDFIKVYFDAGGLQAQFNVTNVDTLRDAQKNPEKYPDLMVRIWGFSAYFIGMPKDYQDHIILRTQLQV